MFIFYILYLSSLLTVSYIFHHNIAQSYVVFAYLLQGYLTKLASITPRCYLLGNQPMLEW